ncbi:MAG: hypothetical protein KBT36_16725 [Kurthia sp.]|nr:hypothetical protein [Candidatus Kurthia equi]
MGWKKYLKLAIPAAIIYIVLIFTLPQEKQVYTFGVFWVLYYGWKYSDEKNNNDKSK